MSAKSQLTILNERKRLLILEADLNRGLIQAECANLRSQFSLGGARNLAGRIPWLAAAGALAGVLAARKWRKLIRWIPAAVAAWRALRRLRRAS